MKNILGKVYFKLFFYTEDVVWEITIFFKFLKPIPNFLSHIVSMDMLKTNRQGIFEFFITPKKAVFIPQRKVLINLDTFKFGASHFYVIFRASGMAKS